MNQRQLAAAVGTSQQQIQRLETGSPVKLSMAVELAKSLDTTFGELFPESKSVLQKISRKENSHQALLQNTEIENSLLKAGI